jgi:hypothetical protein
VYYSMKPLYGDRVSEFIMKVTGQPPSAFSWRKILKR